MSKTQAPSFSQIPKERKMYSIGEFAVVNKISPRMLRHYDKIGLFQPCAVLENGYRCYSSEQIPTISLIKNIKLVALRLPKSPDCCLPMKIRLFPLQKKNEVSWNKKV